MRHLLAALSIVLLTIVAPHASACSIAYFVNVEGLGTAEAPIRSVDGAFPIFMTGEYVEQLPAIVVTDADGTEVAGTQEGQEAGHTIWAPDASLEAGSYTVTLEHDGSVNGPSEGVLEVTGEPVQAPALDMVELEWNEVPSQEQNCCSRSLEETCEFDTCGGYDGCEVCWSVRYDYQPTLRPSFTNAPSSYLIRTTVTTASGEYTDLTIGTGTGDVEAPVVHAAHTATGPFCLTAEFIDTEGNSLGATEERCFEEADFPEFSSRPIDNTNQLSQCVDTPDDPDDPNWIDYDEKPPGTKSGGGCSTATTGSSGAPLLLLALFAWRRRRTRDA